MSTLNEVQAFLNIEIGDKRLKEGKKRSNKNQYYYYEQLYYIIRLTRDKWMIAEDCQKTRILLRKHYWCAHPEGYAQTNVIEQHPQGYVQTNVYRSTKKFHQLFFNYEDGLLADHINNKTFDNRIDNIRIVTHVDNMHNLSKRSDNISGKQGVSFKTTNGYEYWYVQIANNKNKIQKRFSIKKLGDVEAKRQAIEYRKQLEVQYGYIGD